MMLERIFAYIGVVTVMVGLTFCEIKIEEIVTKRIESRMARKENTND